MLDLSLYLVTDRRLTNGRRLQDVVEEAVAGGVSVVQLREKEASTREFYQLAVEIKQILSKSNIPLIINDRLDIAIACGADGVHIGQSDMPYDVVRRLMGCNKIIGLSVESIEEVENANKLDADYIALSPIFGTQTKLDLKQPFEEEGLKRALQITKHKIIAIGGINVDNIHKCKGLDGVAVVSAILAAADPKHAAEELKRKIDLYKR